jgi:glyoxylase-like metal-dependent hydrolase (beta-lactamase superfamily II)
MIMDGSVTVDKRDTVRFHTYTSPADGLVENTHIVEGRNRLVLLDAQLFLAYAREVADYAEGLGKPVERIIVSHGHPDHWSGLEVLTRRFPKTPVYALPEVRDHIAQDGQTTLDTAHRIYGDHIASAPVVPDRVLAEGSEVLDGITWEYQKVLEVESPAQLVIRFPELRTLATFDLVFANRYHLFTIAPYFDHWIEILRSLKQLRSYDRFLAGHGEATDPSALDGNIRYLQDAKAIHASTTSADEYTERLRAKYPEREQPGWVDFSALFLYAGINP